MQLNKITSKNNETIKDIAKIVADSGYREKKGFFCIEGLRICADALKSGIDIKKFFFTERFLKKYPDKAQELINFSVESAEISEEIAKKISTTNTNQGVFCICRLLDKKMTIDTIEKKGKYIALENVKDPTNLGAIIRTAEALGISGIILSPGCCDIYNDKVLRATMGSIFRINFIETSDFTSQISALKNNMQVLGAVPDEKAKILKEVSFNEGIIVIIGNEAHGISEEVKNICTDLITIPMRGKAESLNAAMASCIIMWEMMR